MKNILLFEPDKETETIFSGWLRDGGCVVSSTDSLEKIPLLLAKKEFDILIVDIDFSEAADSPLKLCTKLKSDPHFSGLPIMVLIYKKDIGKIAGSIEAGADNFMLKPFDVDPFLVRLDTILDEHKLKLKGKKALDLNYINYLIELADKSEREDFFVLAPVIFNKLIIDKVRDFLGEPVVLTMLNRIKELTEDNYAFMKHAKFKNGRLLMDEIDKVSKDISVKILTIGFQNFVFAFLHLVQTLTSNILMRRGKN